MSKNVYYEPGAFGLTIVAELDPKINYEFDTTVVWKDGAGEFYVAHDEGCSCPTPFENHDMTTLHRVHTLNEVIEFVNANGPHDRVKVSDVFNFMRAVRNAMESK